MAYIKSGVPNWARKPFYNVKARNAAYDRLQEIKNEMHRMMDADEDETEEGLKRWQALDASWRMQLTVCEGLQYHVCKNEWFAKVVAGVLERGFPDNEGGKYIHISRKQEHAFISYCYEETEYTWKDYETHCRVGNNLVTLCRNNMTLRVTPMIPQ